MYQVLKRDGGTVEFEISKISAAMIKAFEALNKQYHPSVVNMLALQVSADFEPKIKNGLIAVAEAKSIIGKLSLTAVADGYKAVIFYLPENADSIDLSAYDYIADCIDTVSAKVELITRANAAGVPIISAMGAGNKLDPSRFSVTDLAKTETCPLARVLRQRLRKKGIEHLQVVYSTEPPLTPLETIADGGRKQLPGSVSFVPSAAGLVAAGAVIRALTEK